MGSTSTILLTQYFAFTPKFHPIYFNCTLTFSSISVREITKRLKIFQNSFLHWVHKRFNSKGLPLLKLANKLGVIALHWPWVLLQNLTTVLSLQHQTKHNYISHPCMMSKLILFLMLFQTNRFSVSHAYFETFCLKNVKLEKNCHIQCLDCSLSAYSPAAELDSSQSLAMNL